MAGASGLSEPGYNGSRWRGRLSWWVGKGQSLYLVPSSFLPLTFASFASFARFSFPPRNGFAPRTPSSPRVQLPKVPSWPKYRSLCAVRLHRPQNPSNPDPDGFDQSPTWEPEEIQLEDDSTLVLEYT